MKVYVITKGEYSDYGICAVTLDKENAKKLKEYFSDKTGNAWDEEAMIEEYETDVAEEIAQGKRIYEVDIYDGEVSCQAKNHVSYRINEVVKVNARWYSVEVVARDGDRAKKIGCDKIAEYKYREAMGE